MLFKLLLIGGLIFLLYRSFSTKSLPEGDNSDHKEFDRSNGNDEDYADYEEIE